MKVGVGLVGVLKSSDHGKQLRVLRLVGHGQQGSAAGAAVTVGTVTDAQTPAGSLTVTQVAGGTPSGIAVAGLTKTCAVEYGKKNIRINAICPGVIRTPLLEKHPSLPELEAQLIPHHPIGRLGEVDEVANVVLFILTRPRGMTIRDVVMMPTHFDL